MVILSATLLTGGAAAGWYFLLRSDPTTPSSVHAERLPDPPPDPRLTVSTPFKNVHPSVKYAGDAACAVCHKEIDGSYHKHPMGRSAAFVGKETPLEKYDASGQNPFRTPSHQLTVVRDGDRMIHKMAGGTPTTTDLPPTESKIDLVLGSGTRGRSYLTFDHGSVWQTGISWFTDDARWNVSPGFDLGKGGLRSITAECLFCHINSTDPVAGSNNLYKQAVVGQPHIGCERCHGPGELHVRHQANTPPAGPDHTIVNPKRLSGNLQLDICRQCHLLGEQRVVRRGRDLFEYRPGLPLDLFQTVFVRRPDLADSQRSVGQFEQMERSTCFTKSNGAMTCTSCHDPHVAPEPAAKAAFYRGKCLTCHTDRGCSQPEPLRKAKNDSCVACHMPRRDSTSIAHAAVTEHRILRHSDKPPAPTLALGELPIVQYKHGTPGPGAEEVDRDLGIALSRQLPKLTDPTVARQAVSTATNRLSAATRRWPDDQTAWLQWAGLRDPRGRLEAARKAAALPPESEEVLKLQVVAESTAREYATALAIVDRLIQMNPASIEYRQLRASVLIDSRDWVRAEAACRNALTLNPLAAEARVLLAMSLNGQGKRAEAEKQAEIGLALETNPALQRQFRDWLRR